MGIERVVCDFTKSCLSWRSVDDIVMGGLSRSDMRVDQSGRAIFSGVVSLERNGGFASVRSVPDHHDYADCNCFTLRVCGDGRRYSLRVRNDERFDGLVYSSEFGTIEGQWMEIKLPFSGFSPLFRGLVVAGAPPMDPGNVAQIGVLISSKQEGPFCLQIDWIKAMG
ncbi:MAG: CIA30 family protein [Chlorobiaceae bacterium]|nr:CIA30 family protein [Chlorobiaceae bacterium]